MNVIKTNSYIYIRIGYRIENDHAEMNVRLEMVSKG